MVTIRCNSDTRKVLKRWCGIKNMSMPRLLDEIVQYVERKKQQAFYNGLPKPLTGKRVVKKRIQKTSVDS